jgi:hypothetical protein
MHSIDERRTADRDRARRGEENADITCARGPRYDRHVRRLLIVLIVLSTSCGPVFSTPQASPQFAYYQYTVATPTSPLAPNEQMHLVWEPRRTPGSAPTVYAMELCVALFGPWDTVEALKTAISAAGPGPLCPPKGAVLSSETIKTTSNSGARFVTDLVVPAATGFYDVHQISITSDSEGRTSATSAGGIIQVRTK